MQTKIMITGAVEETNWSDTKLEYTQDLNNSMERNTNSEKRIDDCGLARVMFRRDSLTRLWLNWQCGSWESRYICTAFPSEPKGDQTTLIQQRKPCCLNRPSLLFGH